MRNGFPVLLLALLWVAGASTASAQCKTCGHPGPYGPYESLRSVPIFRGGSLEQIPEPATEPESSGTSGMKTAKIPSLRRTAAPAKSSAAAAQVSDMLAPSAPAAGSSRRTIARDGSAAVDAPPGDSFRMKEPKMMAPSDPATAAAAQGLDKVDPSKGRIPKYRYSGSQFPYYFGRSYVNYPHYEQWHEPLTDARRQERKMRFLNTFFEPLFDFTHGVETETDSDAAPKPSPAGGAK